MTGFPVHHQLPELAQTHVHRVDDAIQPSHPLSSPSPPAFNLSQHQGLFQWVSSSYSFPNLEPVSCSMSSSNCSFLTCIQIYQDFLKNLPQFIVIYTVKSFGVVNEAEVVVFLELSCFFYDPMDVGNLISGSSAFLKSSLNIWKFTIHILLKPGLENFEHYFASMWDECNCAVFWNILWQFPSLGL